MNKHQLDTNDDFYAAGNWWCTTDAGEIATGIYDVYDDSNLG